MIINVRLVVAVALQVVPSAVLSFSTQSPPPAVYSKQLFPFQVEGVDRLVADKKLLLADEMGLGKTVQCIEAINKIGNEKLVALVVCPKSVIGVWESELESWLQLPLKTQIATPKSFPLAIEGSITLINYDICHKYRDVLHETEYDVVICDEAHYLKSRNTKRTQAVLGTGEEEGSGIRSKYLWLLTGTPVLNRPVELFPLLRAINPQEFGSFEAYTDRYCDPKTASHGRGHFSMDYSGATNLVELSERLEPIMLRRYKADVLTQLPPKFRSCLCLTDPYASRVERERIKEIMKASSSNVLMDGSVGMTGGSNKNMEEFVSDASDLLSSLYGVSEIDMMENPENRNKLMGSIATVRKETALLKLEPAAELLEDMILSEKVVVFAHHRHVILELTERFGDKAVCVLGGMDTTARSEAVQKFQQDSNVRIFVGSIRAAGVGLTLTAASHVIFLELDWSPGVMSQAEDRCHRVGQRDSVQIQYFVFKDTIDEWVAKSLLFKQFNIDQILPENKLPAGTEGADHSYVFAFGKYVGIRLEDVPASYVQFLVQKEVWRNRPELWHALFEKGVVLEKPPNAHDPSEPIVPVLADKQHVDYVFDFGKHSGKEWNDVPLQYRAWIMRERVWKNNENLKKALNEAGVEIDD